MVLQMLPASGTSLSAVREGFWTPLEDLVAYMETAKAVLAPGDRDFYRKMGFYGGSHVRALPVGIALSEQMRALRLYRMLWRTFFDAGDLEVIEACPEGAILRIRDFPSAAPFCQRLLGSVETVRVAKSESRETTFDSDLRGLSALEPVLETLSAELCRTLARQERRGRTIGIKVRLDDFSTHTRARTREEATNDLVVVRETARALLREFDPPRPVRLLGVRVAGLDEEPGGRRPPRAATAGQLELSL